MAKPFLALASPLPAALLFAAACGGSALENNAMVGAGGSGAGASAAAGSSAGTAPGGSVSGGAIGFAGSTSSGGSGGTDLTACKSNSECKVVPVSCCSCGLGSIEYYTAINAAYDEQYNMRCGDTGCGCPIRRPNANDPVLYYVATCSAGHCRTVDLGATPVTASLKDSVMAGEYGAPVKNKP